MDEDIKKPKKTILDDHKVKLMEIENLVNSVLNCFSITIIHRI